MGVRSIRHVRVAIVGAGFAGLGTAIRLKQEGFDDFLVLERDSDVGGVWRDNTYPGCACDVESHLYSFSFAPNPTWSRSYSPQREIHGYLRRCATRFGVLPHICFGHELREARWDEGRRLWSIETSRGSLTADVLVAANGALSDPAIPRIPGLDRFAGQVFHSARWNHEVDLTGKRVAVIGTGASAIQFVPAIQPRVGKLHLFQRTPPWVLPRGDRPISRRARRVYERSPSVQRAVRAAIYAFRELLFLGFREGRVARWAERGARRYLRRTIQDPLLRAKLTPTYRMGCKRILLSDDYLPSLTRANVEVVTDGIRQISERSIITADGVERGVDAIIFGTGFQVADPPIARLVRGRQGTTLADAWQGSPRAYLGMMVVGFPNFFLLQGPNTGLGHTSVLVMIEAQIEHALKAIRHLERHRAAALEPCPEAQRAFVAAIDERMRGSVWTSGGCASWYLDAAGRNWTLWPGYSFTFRRSLARFDPTKYVITARATARPTEAANDPVSRAPRSPRPPPPRGHADTASTAAEGELS